MQDQIQDGSHVFIFLDAKRNWIRKVAAGTEFHSNRGIIKFDDMIGKPYGIRIESHSGTIFQIHRPSPTDIQIAMGRNTQIVYPKDAGTILIEAGIGAGARIVESGTGSGALTSILSRAVGPSGHVYTYEIREDMYDGAKKNLEKFGLTENITMPSRCIASYSPTIEQTMKTCKALGTDGKWGMIKTLEVLQREIMVRENKTRPTTWMVAHTGYITVARTMIAEDG
jgi:tRNA (adenine57-N1/adenine58-N1)-methyltransferase